MAGSEQSTGVVHQARSSRTRRATASWWIWSPVQSRLEGSRCQGTTGQSLRLDERERRKEERSRIEKMFIISLGAETATMREWHLLIVLWKEISPSSKHDPE
jgi:hypothetical protein